LRHHAAVEAERHDGRVLASECLDPISNFADALLQLFGAREWHEQNRMPMPCGVGTAMQYVEQVLKLAIADGRIARDEVDRHWKALFEHGTLLPLASEAIAVAAEEAATR